VPVTNVSRAHLELRTWAFRKGSSVSTVEKRTRLHEQAANNSKNDAGSDQARQKPRWMNAITAGTVPVAASLALVGLATVVLLVIKSFAPLNLIPLFYMLPVVLAATRWGVTPGLLAAVAGAAAADFFFYPPLYSFWLDNRQDVIDLLLYLLVAIVTSNLAARLKTEADTSRRRAKEIGELHAFSQRLATCLTSRELIFAVQDYLSNTLGYRVVLIAGPAAPDYGFESASLAVPEVIRREASELAAANKTHTLTKVDPRTRSAWLITTIVPEILGYGATAIDLGVGSADGVGHIAKHVTAVIEEVTATLKNLKVKEAIEQATINYQTEILRDALVGGVSHELRTPLASILGACSVLNQMPVILNDEPSQALIDAIHGQAIALDRQIRDVLDAVRISAKGVHPQLMWTDPTDIVDAAVKQKTTRLAGHQIVFDVHQDVPLVYVDSVLVEQAFGQLLENAAKYSPAGTAIKIRSRCDRGFVELSVADQGSGLTAEEKEQLGKRSYRSERNAAVSGSGLGLWIASTFIAANGGTLYAESDGPHLGTTISLRLPTVSDDTPELLDALND
jgi:K+-sensing histidine kinase KdpD